MITLAAVFWTLLFAVATLMVRPFSETRAHQLARCWARGVCRLWGFRVRVIHPERIAYNGGVLFAPNHQSLFDIPILLSLPIDLKWIAKRQVRYIPLVGWAARALGCYFLSRTNPSADVHTLHEVERGLRQGKKVVIFPEGTRSPDGSLLPLKKGAFRTAQNTGVPLVPVGISGRFGGRRNGEIEIRVGMGLYSTPQEPVLEFMQRYRKELVRLLEDSPPS